jgi:hypothetical protein
MAIDVPAVNVGQFVQGPQVNPNTAQYLSQLEAARHSNASAAYLGAESNWRNAEAQRLSRDDQQKQNEMATLSQIAQRHDPNDAYGFLSDMRQSGQISPQTQEIFNRQLGQQAEVQQKKQALSDTLKAFPENNEAQYSAIALNPLLGQDVAETKRLTDQKNGDAEIARHSAQMAGIAKTMEIYRNPTTGLLDEKGMKAVQDQYLQLGGKPNYFSQVTPKVLDKESIDSYIKNHMDPATTAQMIKDKQQEFTNQQELRKQTETERHNKADESNARLAAQNKAKEAGLGNPEDMSTMIEMLHNGEMLPSEIKNTRGQAISNQAITATKQKYPDYDPAATEQSAKQFQKNRGALQSTSVYLQNASDVMGIVNAISRTGVPVIDKHYIDAQEATGNPDATALKVKLATLADELGTTLGASTGANGQLSDKKLEFAQSIFKQGGTPDQIQKALNIVAQSAENKKVALYQGGGPVGLNMAKKDATLSGEAKTKLGIGTATASATPKTQAEYDALPSGTVYVDTDGATKRKK